MTTAETISVPKTEFVQRAAWRAGVLGAVNVFTAILAVRLILLISVCGAVALTYLVLLEPDPYRLGALGIYAGGVLLPLIWLSARR